MSTAFTTPRPVARAKSHTATLATEWLDPTTAVITAHGDLDASNAPEFTTYVVAHADHVKRLVLDLSAVDFFGTAGFSALHSVNVRCAGAKIDWVLVPSHAVSRLLRICDPDSALPITTTVGDGQSAPTGEPKRLLKLVSEAR